MQDWAIMVIAIVAISTLGGIVSRALKQRSEHGGARVAELEQRVAALEGLKGLEGRVRSLEAIVTDPRHDLARQINALERGGA